MKKFLAVCLVFLFCFSASIHAQIPTNILVQIVRAEDERRFDKTLEDLMKNTDERIRVRAALAAGRIGDERAVSPLVVLLETDSSDVVRRMAAFALGEIESLKAADAIIKVLAGTKADVETRARAVEAAGKIAAANAKDEKSKQLGEAILQTLRFENEKRSGPYKTIIALGLTATLRARPADAEQTLVKFTDAYTPQIRANALNALARLRAKNANENARELLQTDTDAIVRANAARVLGAAEDADSFDLLLKAAASDADSRVRASAIRSLASLKNAKAADKLLERGNALLADHKKSKSRVPTEKNELLEIATTLGRILPNAKNQRAVQFLNDLREADKYQSIEPEIAMARLSPEAYLKSIKDLESDEKKTENFGWLQISSLAQGMGELANSSDEALKREAAHAANMKLVAFMMPQLAQQRPEFLKALPDVLRSFAAFKTDDAPKALLDYLKHGDVFVRAAAADLIGDLPPKQQNVEALNRAFDYALITDKQYNDAHLAILDALQKQGAARGALLLALKESDYLLRQKAMQIIRANNLTKDDAALKVQFEEAEKNLKTLRPLTNSSRSKLGVILNTDADYTRAVSRKNARAILTTEKGTFTIEFFPEDAPLTVDNFIRLAKANYFNGLMIHRVVPNFVMQDGDPRGDGNGGPGWQIRCELNMREYERGAVGMALSGKDTGGSQWFVTHSPQPHLDGGYTVFASVNETDMKIVDNLTRGDKILSVKIIEGNITQKGAKEHKK